MVIGIQIWILNDDHNRRIWRKTWILIIQDFIFFRKFWKCPVFGDSQFFSRILHLQDSLEKMDWNLLDSNPTCNTTNSSLISLDDSNRTVGGNVLSVFVATQDSRLFSEIVKITSIWTFVNFHNFCFTNPTLYQWNNGLESAGFESSSQCNEFQLNSTTRRSKNLGNV